MKKRKVILSATYSLGQISTGLILHPYQTMQSLVREKVFVWMTFAPVFALFIVVSLWRMALLPVLSLLFDCSAIGYFNCEWLSFFANVIIFYCMYWQILLLYLLTRFSLVFGKNYE